MLPILQIEKLENCGLEKLGSMFKTTQDYTFSLVADLLAINPMLFKLVTFGLKKKNRPHNMSLTISGSIFFKVNS